MLSVSGAWRLRCSVSQQHTFVRKNTAILFISVGCLVLGLLVGTTGTYLVLMPHYTKKGAEVFFTAEAYKLGEAAERSFQAYKHESKPVAIYALSEYLLEPVINFSYVGAEKHF